VCPKPSSAAPHEARASIGQPWLKRFNEDGKEVMRVLELDATGKTGSWRIPTAEQLEVGIVAETRAEYDQLKAGDQI
jgi:hypothetical protein